MTVGMIARCSKCDAPYDDAVVTAATYYALAAKLDEAKLLLGFAMNRLSDGDSKQRIRQFLNYPPREGPVCSPESEEMRRILAEQLERARPLDRGS